MSFLPDDYQVPGGTSQFMKFEQGENKVRILSEPLMGYEWWEDTDEGRRPFRVKEFETAVREGEEPIKHFWAMIVFNYNSKQIQVLEITQKTIQRAITTYAHDEDWGDPRKYDLIIHRSGEGLETEYQVIPKPKKKLSKDIEKAYSDADIDLEALFRGEYPVEEEVDTKKVADDIPF